MRSRSAVICNEKDLEKSKRAQLRNISPARKRLLIRTPEKCKDDFDNAAQKLKPIGSRMAVEILRTNSSLCFQIVEEASRISNPVGIGNILELENNHVYLYKQKKLDENTKRELSTMDENPTECLAKAVAVCAVCPNDTQTCQFCVSTMPTSAPLKKTVTCYDNYHHHADFFKQDLPCCIQKLFDEPAELHLGVHYLRPIVDCPTKIRYITVRSDAIVIKRQFRKLRWGEKLMRKLRHM